jgi:glycerol-3-phosphate acyltransferase PlsY
MAWFLALGSYLLGSIPFGLLLARARGVEIRSLGSGNIGATNVARSLGRTEGLLTLLCDAGKGFLPTLLAAALGLSAAWMGTVALLATLGHVYPLWLRFRGGKGVATGWGAFLAATPWAALSAAALFALTFALSRRVSPASLLAAASLPLLVLAFGGPAPLAWAAGLMALLVIFRHRENLRRLWGGQESRFDFSERP